MTNDISRRLKRLDVSHIFIFQLIRELLDDQLPEDAELVAIANDPNMARFQLAIRSSEYDIVPDGAQMDCIKGIITQQKEKQVLDDCKRCLKVFDSLLKEYSTRNVPNRSNLNYTTSLPGTYLTKESVGEE